MKKILYRLIFESQKVKATDIHFLISNRRNSCEMRGISGFKSFEDEQIEALFQYLKYCANLDLGNLAIPQSGTFQMNFQDKNYYFRFSCISSYQSQTGVLRILNNHPPISIHQCSTKKTQNAQFKRWCSLRSGLILFSGPTGSGKTTTLHALLEEIARQKKLKIITLEDPIEIVSSNYLQLQVNEKMNFTYEEGIKQLLRHDPDVIMIGEIRDSKCAEMVYRAALSGHLVFSTIHAKSATEAIKRLSELGLSTSNLKETLTAVVNQRLYPDIKRKERICIYEILDRQELQNYLEYGKTENHKTIQDEIREAIRKKIIRPSDAKIDLNDF
ncbi:ATPase, T2SS/T4P/T4SS family [Traorella massiliensis]|uniref:ATPase, T2SS/T4P/T4SS family n=1 Tax=Traorella massiliensis TaxID=1903263 RepID=UPI00235433AC|nr:ATPase, T2SS/T4P/T4SS family [Traorella massiliensis]